MAGRAPRKVYVYDEDGMYLCMFETMVEFRKVYYPKDGDFKRPLFVHKELGIEYHYMKDLELIAVTDRSAGRDTLKRIMAIHNSEYCKKEDNQPDIKPVQVFNFKNELIAEFKSARLVCKLMPHINQSTLSRHLNSKSKSKTHNELGLFFKYKE
jgi:hypothetical protein